MMQRKLSVPATIFAHWRMVSSKATVAGGLAFKKYPFLQQLGLGEDNDGVYNGKWFANGEVST